jgi:hypothetical protein
MKEIMSRKLLKSHLLMTTKKSLIGLEKEEVISDLKNGRRAN